MSANRECADSSLDGQAWRLEGRGRSGSGGRTGVGRPIRETYNNSREDFSRPPVTCGFQRREGSGGSSASSSSRPEVARSEEGGPVARADGEGRQNDCRRGSSTEKGTLARVQGSRGGRGASGKGIQGRSDPHGDLMQAMCMICLEKLSDPPENGPGGQGKLLGLLDSCSHRYCYAVSPCSITYLDSKTISTYQGEDICDNPVFMEALRLSSNRSVRARS
ncbi:unnamed protein product [Choristocarpus tenellus]